MSITGELTYLLLFLFYFLFPSFICLLVFCFFLLPCSLILTDQSDIPHTHKIYANEREREDCHYVVLYKYFLFVFDSFAKLDNPEIDSHTGKTTTLGKWRSKLLGSLFVQVSWAGRQAGGILALRRKERWADREMVEWFLLPHSLSMVKGCLFVVVVVGFFFFVSERRTGGQAGMGS